MKRKKITWVHRLHNVFVYPLLIPLFILSIFSIPFVYIAVGDEWGGAILNALIGLLFHEDYSRKEEPQHQEAVE